MAIVCVAWVKDWAENPDIRSCHQSADQRESLSVQTSQLWATIGLLTLSVEITQNGGYARPCHGLRPR